MNNPIQNSTTKSGKMKFLHGLLLWTFISIGYLAFVANWGFTIGLNGKGINGNIVDTGVLGYFNIVNDKNFALINQATNWGITIGRGIGSILVAFMLAKMAHKYSTIVALTLTLFGIPAQFLTQNATGYVFFIILRTTMAIGGTMLIILTQPVVANFFNKKQKSIVSQFGIWFYPLGTIITIIPFVFIANTSAIREHWQIILTTIAAINILPLLFMIFFGSKFDIQSNNEKIKKSKVNNFKILKSYLKNKSTYVWTLLFGGFLMAAVFPTAFSIDLFKTISQMPRNEELSLFGLGTGKIIRIWFIIFLSSIFIGSLTLGLWSKYNLKRKWFITTSISLSIVFYILAMITFVFGVSKSNTTALVFFYILGFLSGYMLWGIQGIMLNLPHEYEDNNPKTIGWMFALIWGFGYLFFTIGVIIMSLISTIGNQIGLDPLTTASIKFIVLILLSSISIIGALMIKEPNKNAQTFPNWMKFKSKNKINRD